MNGEARARRGMDYVPQSRMIFPLRTVEENLRLPLPARKTSMNTVPDLIDELFPVLAEMRHRRGNAMTGLDDQLIAEYLTV